MITFAEVRPDLAIYYKPELNDGRSMWSFSRGNSFNITLCCEVCGNNNEAVQARYYGIKNSNEKFKKFKCWYCNSLGAKRSDISEEWNYNKNIKTPFDYPCGSNKKVWWQCKNGHEWEAMITNRATHNQLCPHCQEKSKGETIIENWLKENNIEFIVQYGKGHKKFDFYLPEEKIFVEVHGIQHFEPSKLFRKYTFKERQEIDAEKQAYAEANGQYMMVDYREHKPELALERFIDALAELA